MSVSQRPLDTLLAWLSAPPENERTLGHVGLTPIDLALFQECAVVARRLVVFCDPFLSTDADRDIDAINQRYKELERADVAYMLGIAVGLELAAATQGLDPETRRSESEVTR
jgi:hypothetical protein